MDMRWVEPSVVWVLDPPRGLAGFNLVIVGRTNFLFSPPSHVDGLDMRSIL